MNEHLNDYGQGELGFIAKKVADAKNPEDVFGLLDDAEDRLKAGHSLYRRFSKLTHPDLHTAEDRKLLAQGAFKKLTDLWQEAQKRLRDGTYGTVKEAIDDLIIKTGKKEYHLSGSPYQSGYSNIYSCTYLDGALSVPAVLKIPRDPIDNDLVENEARLLTKLSDANDFTRFRKYFPRLVENFSYTDDNKIKRQANVLSYHDEALYSLDNVRSAYPDGVSPKDIAWVFRRLLVATGFAHQNGLVHGALLPPYVLVQPEKHGLILSEWSYGVSDPTTSGERMGTINADYEDWYPQEVFKKETPTPGLDIYMGAKTMVLLMGGNPITGELPETVDRRLRAFFRGCLMPNPRQRAQDAWGLLQEFDGLLEDMWGPRKFHPFLMPAGTKPSPYR